MSVLQWEERPTSREAEEREEREAREMSEFKSGVLSDANEAVQRRLPEKIVELREFLSGELGGPGLMERVTQHVLSVREMLSTVSLALSLGLPSRSTRDGGAKALNDASLQQSLAAELKTVTAACLSFLTVFAVAQATATVKESLLRPERAAGAPDTREALARLTNDADFMALRYLGRIHSLLISLVDLLQKNSRRFQSVVNVRKIS